MPENNEKIINPSDAPETTAEPKIADETDDALESFLSREQAQQKPVKTGKSNKRIWVPIIAAVAVAALMLLLIFTRHQSGQGSTADEALTSPAEFTTEVNDKGEHVAEVVVDKNGEIVKNGSGKLLSYVPADIKSVKVENSNGSFTVNSHTPKGEATVYSLEGFDQAPLQAGIADEVASACAEVEFIEIISPNGKLADFGLDKPRAVAHIAYHDDTTATLRVGSEAPAEAGTYIAFGDSSAVYLIASDKVKALMYSVNEFISRDITDKAEDSESLKLQTMTISGSRYSEDITIVPNTDEAIEAEYLVTAPRKMFAKATESADVVNAVRGLYAEEVLCVNPSAGQLASYGVAEPYAAVTATYSDATVTLQASAPGDDGLVNVYNPDKNIIYSIQLAAVSWARTGVEDLIPETVLPAKKEAISRIDFSADDKSYSIDVTSKTETVETDEGGTEEITTTSAKYGDKALAEDNFSVFYQNLTGIRNTGDEGGSGKERMRFTLSYTTGREPDTVVVYDAGTAQYGVELNGSPAGSASKAYIDSLIEGAYALVKGETVNSL